MDISAVEFHSRYQDTNSFIIIDVREVMEFQTYNVGGNNIPLGKLLTSAEDLDYDKQHEIVVVCQHGVRSETARRILKGLGYSNVRNLTGGIVAIQKLKSKKTSN